MSSIPYEKTGPLTVCPCCGDRFDICAMNQFMAALATLPSAEAKAGAGTKPEAKRPTCLVNTGGSVLEFVHDGSVGSDSIKQPVFMVDDGTVSLGRYGDDGRARPIVGHAAASSAVAEDPVTYAFGSVDVAFGCIRPILWEVGRRFTTDSLARAIFDTSPELAAIASRNEKTVDQIKDRAWEREPALRAKCEEVAAGVMAVTAGAEKSDDATVDAIVKQTESDMRKAAAGVFEAYAKGEFR